MKKEQEVIDKSGHAEKTLKEINQMVQQGIERMREVLQQSNQAKELEKVINLLAQTWDTVCFQFVVLSAGLYGATKRTPEQIIQQLNAYSTEVDKHSAPMTFKDFRNAIALKGD